MSTFCHGVASAQSLDKSGEIVDIKGLDITSLPKTGVLNYEHKSDIPGQICGKILSAKKIFNKNDCSNDHELYFWEKCKNPFVYITAELLDDYCQSGKDAAGLFKYDHDKKDQNAHAILGFSVEGSEIPNTRKGMLITRSIARKVTLTASPCNSQCVAELLENQKPQVKDDFEEIFKTEANAIELFKSGEGTKMYEQFLAKKEEMGKKSKLEKADAPNWSSGKVDQKSGSVHFNHPEHGVVSIHKQPSGEFHVKHQGKLAGVGGVKGSFGTSKEAGAHAKKYMQAVSQKKIFAPKMQNISSDALLGKSEICKKHQKLKKDDSSPNMSAPPPEPNSANAAAMQSGALSGGTSFSDAMSNIKSGFGMGKKEKNLKKALTAGSTNAAPSTLVNGSAYQTESLSSKQSNSGEHNFMGSKKKDWNKRAKDEYQRWPHKEKFESFMKARMPHLAMGEIEAIGRVLSLKKSIDFEKSLESLVFSKSKK